MFFKYENFLLTIILLFSAVACAERITTEPKGLDLIETSKKVSMQKLSIQNETLKIAKYKQAVSPVPINEVKINREKNLNSNATKLTSNVAPTKLPPITNIQVIVPENAIKILPPSQIIHYEIPKDAINVQMAVSPLLWVTVIVSIITLILSTITLVDKLKKEKKDDNKSIFDDYWFRTVIHPECLKSFSDLVSSIKTDIKHENVNESIHNIRASLHNLELLPGGVGAHLRLSESILKIEDHITLYNLFVEEGMTREDALEIVEDFPEALYTHQVNDYCNTIHKNFHMELVDFHKKLLNDIA